MFFMSERNSRMARPADVVILRSRFGTRLSFLRRAFLRAVGCFTGIALFLSLEFDQRNYGAVDSVIGSAIWAHTERVLATFQVLHFSLAHVQRLGHVSQN